MNYIKRKCCCITLTFLRQVFFFSSFYSSVLSMVNYTLKFLFKVPLKIVFKSLKPMTLLGVGIFLYIVSSS